MSVGCSGDENGEVKGEGAIYIYIRRGFHGCLTRLKRVQSAARGDVELIREQIAISGDQTAPWQRLPRPPLQRQKCDLVRRETRLAGIQHADEDQSGASKEIDRGSKMGACKRFLNELPKARS